MASKRTETKQPRRRLTAAEREGAERARRIRELFQRWREEPEEPGEYEKWLEVGRALREQRESNREPTPDD